MSSKSPIRHITCFSTGVVLIFVLILQSNCENVTRSQISGEKVSSSNLSSLNISSLPGKTPKTYQGSWTQSRSLGSQPHQNTKTDARAAQKNVESSIPFGNGTRNADASANLSAASLRTNLGVSPFDSSRSGNIGTRPTSFDSSRSGNIGTRPTSFDSSRSGNIGTRPTSFDSSRSGNIGTRPTSFDSSRSGNIGTRPTSFDSSRSGNIGTRPTSFDSSRSGNIGTRPTSSTASKNSKAVADRQKWHQRGKAPPETQPDPNEEYKYIWWPIQVNYYPYKKGFKRVLGIPGKFNGNFAASTFPYSSATKYGPLKSFQSQTYVPDSVPYNWEKNRYKHFHAR